MLYGLDKIEKDVRIALDRNKMSEELITGEIAEALTLDDLIDERLEKAARVVLLNAPLHLIGSGKVLPTDEIRWKSQPGYGMGTILLPSDYLRLVTFQMTDWERAVTQPITEESPVYARQHSRYPGMRGCPQRPVVALVTYPAGLALEFFSCRGGEKVAVKRARYLAIPLLDQGNIELPEKCYDGIVYTTAAMVCALLKENELAQSLGETAKQLLL